MKSRIKIKPKILKGRLSTLKSASAKSARAINRRQTMTLELHALAARMAIVSDTDTVLYTKRLASVMDTTQRLTYFSIKNQ